MMGEVAGMWDVPLGFVFLPEQYGGDVKTMIFPLRSFPLDRGIRGYAAPIEDEL